MNSKIRKQIERRERRITSRLDKNDNRGCDRPMMTAANIHYELGQRVQGFSAGGIGAMMLLAQTTGLISLIDLKLHLLKRHLPYH